MFQPPKPMSHGISHRSLVGCALHWLSSSSAGSCPMLTHTMGHGEAGPISKPQFPHQHREGTGCDCQVAPSHCLGDAFSGGMT